MLDLAYSEKCLYLESPIHKLDARIKFLVTLGFIVALVAIPSGSFNVFAIYFTLLLAFLVRLSHVPLRCLLYRSLHALPFMAVILLTNFSHFLLRGGKDYNFLTSSLMRSYFSILALALLSLTTSFPRLLHVFRQFNFPFIFVQAAELMYRYSFVLGNDMARMRFARDSRCYNGKWIGQTKVIGQMIGTFFLRNVYRAQRIYLAMLARGFDQ